ncbi:hypothetical protein SUGI_0990050 [Cryptomeria japonica]|nr:hypothetical protein SUGI_0990050 [Cryptomeria japonica]
MDSASTVKVGGKKRDPCWKHGRPGPKRGDVFCNHCKKIVKGGINRFKYHLAKIQCRDTTSCTECTEEATRDAIATLEAYDQRKATKKRTAEAMAAPRADLSSMGSHTDVGTSGSSLGPRIRAKGTLDSNMENFFIPPEWVASPDDVDNDLDPFLTNEQLSELERAGEEWDAEVAAREEEQEVDHAEEAPVSVEDVATTSAPPTQRPQSILSFSHRRNL